jgi:exopolyphosphatase / guanosine-5'-triphosphate,3'-diphosphate pyrophosphatase
MKKENIVPSAAIDIGTNSVLLLVADSSGDPLTVLHEQSNIPRLGRGVDMDKILQPESCNRVISVLSAYKAFLKLNYPEAVQSTIVTATSAVRDASNREFFLELVKNMTGWNIRILSGKEEAEITFRGALSVLPNSDISRMVIDIGGGSTEIAYGSIAGLKSAFSLDMGSVRFSERFLKSSPPKKTEIKRIRDEVLKLLTDTKKIETETEIVGVAGTVTSVAALELGLDEYDPEKINGHRLSRKSIGSFVDEFSRLNSNQIEHKYPQFLKGRGDVILGGLLILDRFLEWHGRDACTVSTGGIRHGVLIEKARK